MSLSSSQQEALDQLLAITASESAAAQERDLAILTDTKWDVQVRPAALPLRLPLVGGLSSTPCRALAGAGSSTERVPGGRQEMSWHARATRRRDGRPRGPHAWSRGRQDALVQDKADKAFLCSPPPRLRSRSSSRPRRPRRRRRAQRLPPAAPGRPRRRRPTPASRWTTRTRVARCRRIRPRRPLRASLAAVVGRQACAYQGACAEVRRSSIARSSLFSSATAGELTNARLSSHPRWARPRLDAVFNHPLAGPGHLWPGPRRLVVVLYVPRILWPSRGAALADRQRSRPVQTA